jgi:hypothetical protein
LRGGDDLGIFMNCWTKLFLQIADASSWVSHFDRMAKLRYTTYNKAGFTTHMLVFLSTCIMVRTYKFSLLALP